jgi:DDE superfamily endonuclease
MVSVVVMNPPKVQPEQYIDFLLATPKACSATEAQRVQPPGPAAAAHDAFTRLLTRLEPDPEALWQEVRPVIDPAAGWLVVDDTTLDKPHARHMGLVCRHWSGRHHRVVAGINLITPAWTDGDRVYPTDYRLYAKAHDGLTKNDHFRAMLAAAARRGFRPRGVPFDGWYASAENLKAVRALGWTFLARMPANRKLRIDRGPATPVAGLPVAASGTDAWLPEFGLVRVFRVVAPDGDTQHWFTNDPGLGDLGRLAYAEAAWSVEEYHRGLKQCTGVDRCQCLAAKAQRGHIGSAIRAFVRLEYHRFTTGVGWVEAKLRIVRQAVRDYLAAPAYRLPKPATA